MPFEKNYHMKKIHFCNIFVIISMLNIMQTTIPMLNNASRLIARTTHIGSWLTTIGWATYIGAHYIQLKKVHALHDRCARSPESTREDAEKSLYQLVPLTGTFFYRQAILECMKNRDENLKNFNKCFELVNKLTDKE